jgi:hypothetical protein
MDTSGPLKQNFRAADSTKNSYAEIFNCKMSRMKNPDFYREVKKWDSELIFVSVKKLNLLSTPS